MSHYPKKPQNDSAAEQPAQYAGCPPMVTAPGAVVAPVMPPAVAIPNDFQTGLCDCCEDGRSCLDGLCCSWCDAGYQAKALQTGNGGDMDFIVCGALFLLDYCVTAGLAIACYNGCVLRPDVKRKYGITTESDTMTFLKGFCCHECSSCQTHREMIARHNGPGGICNTTAHSNVPAVNPYPAAGYAVPTAPIPGHYPQQQSQKPWQPITKQTNNERI